jgi:hypothetical protein
VNCQGRQHYSALQVAIKNDPTLGALREGWFQIGDSARIIQDTNLVHCLIMRSLEGSPIDPFMRKVRELAEHRKGRVESYRLLAGFTIPHAISLERGIDLIPLSDIPNTEHKIKFIQSTSPNAENLAGAFPRIAIDPTGALRVQHGERTILFSSREEAMANIDRVHTFERRVEDIILCAVALTLLPIRAVGGWTIVDNPVALAMMPMGFFISESIFDHALPKPIPIELKRLKDLTGGFFAIRSNDQGTMRVALDRFRTALPASNFADWAIDLGIALEVMLLHDGRESELAFQMSARGAALLEKPGPGRIELFKLLKQAYRLRSRAVHKGQLEANEATRTILTEVQSVCGRVAQALINNGSFPDWTSLLMGE